MDTAPLKEEFLINLELVDPRVAACFTSTATIPSAVSPAEIAYATVEALKYTQSDYNQSHTAPPYLGIVTRSIDANPVIFEGNLIRRKERTCVFNEVLGAIDVAGPDTSDAIIF